MGNIAKLSIAFFFGLGLGVSGLLSAQQAISARVPAAQAKLENTHIEIPLEIRLRQLEERVKRDEQQFKTHAHAVTDRVRPPSIAPLEAFADVKRNGFGGGMFVLTSAHSNEYPPVEFTHNTSPPVDASK